MDQIHDIRNDYDVQALNSTKPVTTGFENGTLVNIIYLWLTNVLGDVSAAAPRVPCGYVEGERSESPWDNRAKRGSWRGAVLLTHFCRRKLLTCRFGEKSAQPASCRSKAVDSTAAHRFQTGRCHGDAKLVHLGLRFPGFRQARQVMSQWCRLFESCRKEDK